MNTFSKESADVVARNVTCTIRRGMVPNGPLLYHYGEVSEDDRTTVSIPVKTSDDFLLLKEAFNVERASISKLPNGSIWAVFSLNGIRPLVLVTHPMPNEDKYTLMFDVPGFDVKYRLFFGQPPSRIITYVHTPKKHRKTLDKVFMCAKCALKN
jgi:hypothetical protein